MVRENMRSLDTVRFAFFYYQNLPFFAPKRSKIIPQIVILQNRPHIQSLLFGVILVGFTDLYISLEWEEEKHTYLLISWWLDHADHCWASELLHCTSLEDEEEPPCYSSSE